MGYSHKKSKLLICIDDTSHSKVALRFACSKAKHLNFALEMIHVINPSEFNTNSLFGVGDKLRDERRSHVEKLMSNFAEEAQKYSGIIPSCIVREGALADEIMKVINEDGNFNMLIIGKASQEASKKDIITQLVSELTSKIMIPMIIVPGNLTDHQIEELI